MDWEVEQLVRRRAKCVGREPLAGGAPLDNLTNERAGRETENGFERWEIRSGQKLFTLVRVLCTFSEQFCDPMYNFWVIANRDYDAFRELARREARKELHTRAPIMERRQKERIWENTIGFLKNRVQLLKKYGVPQRRGVLLLGEPGNGKTMACRWLRALCRKERLAWRTISAEQYEEARGDRVCRRLFRLPRPGVIQFDDLDIYVRDRDKTGLTSEHTTFLTELDGLETRHGVVYLFTTNAKRDDLDPAFLRPGRIDQVIDFPRPSANLRRKAIESIWHEDIRAAIDIDRAVSETDGRSFAELEEIKKLLALHFIRDGAWDWAGAIAAFTENGSDRPAKRIGFQNAERNAGAESKPERFAISAEVDKS